MAEEKPQPTLAQQAMINDGLPAELILSPSERHAAWEKSPPTTRFVIRQKNDEALRLAAKKRQLAIQQEREAARIERRKKSTPKSLQGLRWDVRTSKWISDGTVSASKPPQEDEMARLTITPYDAQGQLIKRGLTSINDTATQNEIDVQIDHAIQRGGAKRVARVEVTDKDGKSVQARINIDFGAVKETVAAEAAAAVTEAAPAAADTAPVAAETPVADVTSEEVPVAKKRGNGAGPTKVSQVIALCERKSGCTLADIVERLKVSNHAAASLIADVRRQKKSLKRARTDDGTSVYSLS
jgi:hypothetical protein